MIFIFADPHLSANQRDRYRLDFLKGLPKLVHQHKIKEIYLLGDLTDQKDKHRAPFVNMVVDHIAALAREAPIVINCGNHDYAQSDAPFFKFLSQIPNIDFITKPSLIGNRLWLPHTHNHKRDWHTLVFKKVDLILAHQRFRGARSESGQELDGVPLDDLPNIPIISGDAHVPQEIGNLTYVGAPYTINFGDDFEPRALLLRDNNSWKEIALDGPQKRLISVTLDEKGRRWSLGKAKNGDIVRVQMHLQTKDYARWQELREKCERYCFKQGYVLDSVVPLIEQTQASKIKRSKVTERPDQEEFGAYCQRNRVDEKTRQVGEEFI